MKKLIVFFLVLTSQFVGAQTSNKEIEKFSKKLEKVLKKPYEDIVFTCTLPKQDFEVGGYKVNIVTKTTLNWYDFNVIKNNVLIAEVAVYDRTIVKITSIKNVGSFKDAVEEIKLHPGETIALTGESWPKEIVPYLKEVKNNENKFIVIYENITYIIIDKGMVTIYKSK